MSKAGSDPGLWYDWQISVSGHQKRSKTTAPIAHGYLYLEND